MFIVFYYYSILPPTCLLFSDTCSLPAVTGRCRGRFQRYYYNKDRAECLQFVYGGCEGNKNNFNTIDDCERECAYGTSGMSAIVLIHFCPPSLHQLFQTFIYSLYSAGFECGWFKDQGAISLHSMVQNVLNIKHA